MVKGRNSTNLFLILSHLVNENYDFKVFRLFYEIYLTIFHENNESSKNRSYKGSF